MLLKSSAFFIFLLCTTDTFSTEMTKEHENWLKDRFSAQHEKLIPVVAVADIYFGCNKARDAESENLDIPALITTIDRQVLADKLKNCLNGMQLDSDGALNFGLAGCFHEQLKQLPKKERLLRQKLVDKAIASLSKAERKKSFTQCVTDQAIGYLR